MKLVHVFALFVAALCAFSCQPAPGIGDPYTTSLLVQEVSTYEPRMVYLIVADDADTTDAAQIRQRLTQSLREGLLKEITDRWSTCNSQDPAQWHPGDVRIVLARPSAPDGEALLTSIDLPNLAWITNTSMEGEIDAVIAAATEALEKRLALPGEVYRPLHVTARAVDLLTGARSPENANEYALMASLPQSFLVRVVVANTRSDEDSIPASELLPAPSTNDDRMVLEYSVIAPAKATNGSCYIYPLGSSRLEDWSKSMYATFITWPCSDDSTWDGLMQSLWADGYCACYDRSIHTNADGSAECRIFIEQPNLEVCDPERGWKDPGGKTIFVDRNGTPLRQCEIMQHAGEALEACRHSLDCPNCGAGFCVTEVPELVNPDRCSANTHPWPIRYTGGAIAVSEGRVTVYCDMVTD